MSDDGPTAEPARELLTVHAADATVVIAVAHMAAATLRIVTSVGRLAVTEARPDQFVQIGLAVQRALLDHQSGEQLGGDLQLLTVGSALLGRERREQILWELGELAERLARLLLMLGRVQHRPAQRRQEALENVLV